MPSQSDPKPMSTTTAQMQPSPATDASDRTVVKLGVSEPVESWSEQKRRTLAVAIAAKLGCDPNAITITVTEP